MHRSQSHRRARGMGSVVAVATLGLCAVAVSSVTLMVRMDLERTHHARDVAQAVKLLQAGADEAIARMSEFDASALPDVLESVPLPAALIEGNDVSLRFVFAPADTASHSDDMWIKVEAKVGVAFASQRIRFALDDDTNAWVFADVELGPVYTAR